MLLESHLNFTMTLRVKNSKQCCAGQDILDAKRVSENLILIIKFCFIKRNLNPK